MFSRLSFRKSCEDPQQEGLKHAFTLIELIVTIIIMSLVTTIVVVQINREPAMLTINSSAKKLKSMMVRASTQALALNIPVSLAYHQQNHTFVIVYDFNSLVQLPMAKKLEKDQKSEEGSDDAEEELSEEERMQAVIKRAANYSGNTFKLSERVKFCLGEPNNTELLAKLAQEQSQQLSDQGNTLDVLDDSYGTSNASEDTTAKPVIFAKFFPDGTGFGENAIVSLNNFYFRLRISPVTGYIYVEKIDENGDLIEEGQK